MSDAIQLFVCLLFLSVDYEDVQEIEMACVGAFYFIVINLNLILLSIVIAGVLNKTVNVSNIRLFRQIELVQTMYQNLFTIWASTVFFS